MDLTKQLSNATKLIDRWLQYKVYADRIPGLSREVASLDTFGEIALAYGVSEATTFRQ